MSRGDTWADWMGLMAAFPVEGRATAARDGADLPTEDRSLVPASCLGLTRSVGGGMAGMLLAEDDHQVAGVHVHRDQSGAPSWTAGIGPRG